MPKMSTFERVVCQSAPWRAMTSRVVLPWALQGVAPTGEVLEIGGGSGAMAERVLGRFPATRMTTTDLDPMMVHDAARRLRRFGERASVQIADATDLPFPDDSFDVVLSLIMLHHVVDWERALAEAVRVARPGGVLVGYDLLSTLPFRVLHRVEGEPFHLVNREELRTAMGRLPLAELSIVPSVAGFAVRFRCVKQRPVDGRSEV